MLNIHKCEESLPIPHTCEELSFIFHKCEESVPNSHTCENLYQMLTRVNHGYQIFTDVKNW